MRYLLVDRIDELKKDAYAIGTKCISLSDDVFEHHFAGQPVYPGALLVESLAQLGGCLLELSLRERLSYSPRCVLSSVKAKFRDFVLPGDCLKLRVDVRSCHDDSAMVRAVALRDERAVCEADLLYIMLRVEDPRLEAARNDYLNVLTRTTRIIP